MDLLSDINPEPRLASLKARMTAGLIDLFISFGFAYLLSFLVVENLRGNSGSGYAFGVAVSGDSSFILFLIDFALIPLQEGLTGRTTGKRIVGVRVLRDDFLDNSVSRSIVRHLFDLIDLFFGVGLLVAASTLKKQRIGDLIAKTIVVVD